MKDLLFLIILRIGWVIPLLISPGFLFGCTQLEDQLGEKVKDSLTNMSGGWCWLLARVPLLSSMFPLMLQKLHQLPDFTVSGQHSRKAKTEAMSLMRPGFHIPLFPTFCWPSKS